MAAFDVITEGVKLLAAGTPQGFKAASDTIYNIGEWKIVRQLC
jgi:hypothetical protein